MRKKLIKICSFAICFVMLFGLFTPVICAEDEPYTPVEWTIDEDIRYIYGGEKRYDRFYVNYAFYGDAKFKFYFANYATIDGKICRVYGDSADPHIVSVEKGDGYSYIFVDAEGKKILNDFLTRKDCLYRLESFDDNTYAPLNESLVTAFEEEYNSESGWNKTVNVASLGEAKVLEITVHDKTESKAYQHGAIYIMDDETYYYVCFEELSNAYFDADGYFSYRKGTVKALQLNHVFRKDVAEIIAKMQKKTKSTVYEQLVIDGITDIHGNVLSESPVSDSLSRINAIALFWVLLAIFGVIIPIPLLIIGLAFSKKEKYWYVLSAFSTLWIIATLAIALILLL